MTTREKSRTVALSFLDGVTQKTRKLSLILGAVAIMFAAESATAPSSRAQSKSPDDLRSVTIGVITRSGSGVVASMLYDDVELQKKHGLKINLREYASVQAIYTAMAAGEFDMMVGSPDGFAAQARRGVPVRVMSTYAMSSAQIFGLGDKITSAEQLRGKRITAVVAGLWRLTESQIGEKFGLRAGKDYEMISVPNLLAGVTQVLAGTADYAMGWETDATVARKRYPQLKLVLSSADFRSPGEETYMQVFGSRTNVPLEVEKRAVDALSEVAGRVRKNPEAADSVVVKLMKAEPGVLADAVQSGRYEIVVRQPTSKDAEIMKEDLKRISPESDSLPAGFLMR